MERQPLIDFIAKHINASGIAITDIVDYFEEKTFAKNEYLLKDGKVNNDYFILADGLMRAFTFDTNGNEVTTYFYQKNRAVFEVSSFFCEYHLLKTFRLLPIAGAIV